MVVNIFKSQTEEEFRLAVNNAVVEIENKENNHHMLPEYSYEESRLAS